MEELDCIGDVESDQTKTRIQYDCFAGLAVFSETTIFQANREGLAEFLDI
jgi:hypothetical protein